jgi:protein phosphatase
MVRTQNEDSCHAGAGLAIVADGMGGHLAGEIASELAVATVRNACSPAPVGDGDSESVYPTLADLVTSIVDANSAIFRSSINDPAHQGMGTTITLLSLLSSESDPVTPSAIGVANVGDSRTYLMRDGELRQVTVDHSFVQELVDTGQLSPGAARHHPRRNIVTRALGIEPDVQVDAWRLPIVQGDRYILCSDGLVDEVDDDDIADIIAAHPDPQACADALVERANANGGRDNVTVVIVDVTAASDVPFDEHDSGFDHPRPRVIADEVTGEFEVIPTFDRNPHDTADSTDHNDHHSDGIAVITSDGERTDDEQADNEPGKEAGDDDTPQPPQRERGTNSRLATFLAGVALTALVVIALAIGAAWARGTYSVGFTNSDRVMIYRGRDVLWFNPTEEAPGPYLRTDLDPESVRYVEAEPTFDSLDAAFDFIANTLTPTDPDAENE